jgi:methylamine utilization protein MauE
MWRSVLEIWIAWIIVTVTAGAILLVGGAWMAGRLRAPMIHRITLWSRIALSITFLYGGIVKLTNPWTTLGRSIVEFQVGISSDWPWLHALSVAIPWIEVVLAILLLFPLRWVVLTTGGILMAFLGLGVVAAWRQMEVACGCWGGTMLVGPLWFGEHGGMFLMALAADSVLTRRLLAGETKVA